MLPQAPRMAPGPRRRRWPSRCRRPLPTRARGRPKAPRRQRFIYLWVSPATLSSIFTEATLLDKLHDVSIWFPVSAISVIGIISRLQPTDSGPLRPEHLAFQGTFQKWLMQEPSTVDGGSEGNFGATDSDSDSDITYPGSGSDSQRHRQRPSQSSSEMAILPRRRGFC